MKILGNIDTGNRTQKPADIWALIQVYEYACKYLLPNEKQGLDDTLMKSAPKWVKEYFNAKCNSN